MSSITVYLLILLMVANQLFTIATKIGNLYDYKISLGSYLLANVDNEQLEANVRQAQSWLLDLDESVKVKASIGELHAVLVMLNEISTKSHFCGRDGIKAFKLLKLLDTDDRQNKQAVEPRDQLAQARVDAILAGARKMYGYNCRRVATTNMVNIFANMEAKVAARVKTYNELVKSEAGTPDIYASLTSGPVSSFYTVHTASNLASGAFRALLEADNDPLVGATLNRANLIQADLHALIYTYVSGPCERYLSAMEQQIESIRFDELFMMEYRDVYDELDNNKELIEMYETCSQTKHMLPSIAFAIQKKAAARLAEITRAKSEV